MPLVEIHWRPSTRQLRQFALIAVAGMPLGAYLLTHSFSKAAIGLAVGACVGVAGWVAPQVLRPLFVGLSVLTAPIGMVVGEIAMIVIFALVVTPIGVALRLLGRDPLAKSPDESASYWEPHSADDSPSQYYRQF
ncbi:MAG: hypothetical protein KDB14_10370 [Planctomycetales bacterium]|nr:hypothetical protein [Planctomycetales bacterium]